MCIKCVILNHFNNYTSNVWDWMNACSRTYAYTARVLALDTSYQKYGLPSIVVGITDIKKLNVNPKYANTCIETNLCVFK